MITEQDLQKIKEWDLNNIFELMRFIYSHWEDKKTTCNMEFGKDGDLLMELNTSNGSRNNSLIVKALSENKDVWSNFWYGTNRERIHQFKINVKDIGYQRTLDYCLEKGMSRNAPFRSRHLYWWYIYSDKIMFVKRKTKKERAKK